LPDAAERLCGRRAWREQASRNPLIARMILLRPSKLGDHFAYFVASIAFT
jgi:hypothetical protein